MCIDCINWTMMQSWRSRLVISRCVERSMTAYKLLAPVSSVTMHMTSFFSPPWTTTGYDKNMNGSMKWVLTNSRCGEWCMYHRMRR